MMSTTWSVLFSLIQCSEFVILEILRNTWISNSNPTGTPYILDLDRPNRPKKRNFLKSS